MATLEWWCLFDTSGTLVVAFQRLYDTFQKYNTAQSY